MTDLVPHDGCCETFVCRDCEELIDPASEAVEGTTCPHCGSQDTAWMHAASSTEAETTEWAILAHLRTNPGDTVARLQLADLWEESGEADLIERATRHRKIASVNPTGPLTATEKAEIRESYAEFWECDPEDIRIAEGYDAAYGVHFFDVDTDHGRKGDETTYLCCEVAETSYDRLCR